MTAYERLKFTTILILVLGLVIDIPIVFSALNDAIQYQSLQGAGRAQAEFFLMPLLFVGGPIAIIALVTALVNGIVDGRKKQRISKWSYLVYFGLLVLILIPILGSSILLDIMYSGWR